MSDIPADGTRNFLWAYYAYIFLFDFIVCYAIYTAYFEFQGLSYFEIGVLLAFWSASALLLELFAGALSDWLDRRWLLIAAPLIKTLTFVAWALADGNFWIYGLGFLFWSAGQALFSGTHEALLYERLEASGRSEDFDRLYSRASAMESYGIGAGLLLGGFVAAQSMELTIWLSIPPLVLAGIIAIFLVDVRRTGELSSHDADEEDLGFFGNFGVVVQQFRALPDLRFLLLYLCLGLILFEELEEFDQLFYVAVDLPLVLFGVVGGIALGINALISSQAYRLGAYSALSWILPGLAGLVMIGAAFGDTPYYVVVLELAYLIAVPAAILAEARFQKVMDGKSRATVTSALYLAQNVTALIVAVLFGWLANVIGILPSYAWAGILMLAISACLWLLSRKGMQAL